MACKNYRKEKNTFFKHVLILISMYDKYRNGDKTISVKQMREIASTFKVGSLKLNNSGTDEEFLTSLARSYVEAKMI